MENVQNVTLIELRITQDTLFTQDTLLSFFRCELACFDQVGITGLKPNSDFR